MKMTFSEKLAKAIQDKEMSIRELSERTGIPKSAIQRYTSGSTEKIPIDRMMLMAEALGIEPAYVMGWEEKTAPIRAAFSSDSPVAQKLHEIGEQLTPLLHPETKTESDPDRQELLDIYDRLNERGQADLLKYARYLNADPDMTEDGRSNSTTA